MRADAPQNRTRVSRVAHTPTAGGRKRRLALVPLLAGRVADGLLKSAIDALA